jgi:HNH endonuclease
MNRETEHIVRLRAGGVCEYCRLPENISHLPFQLDHIIARQHRGPSTEENLALACPECNHQKGPNIASIDWRTGELVRLFNPRKDRWADHFRWNGAALEGMTPIGEATVRVLGINHSVRLELRKALMDAGIYPRDPSGQSEIGTDKS